jgi:hypothetical protein
MKATLSQANKTGSTMWEGEVLNADWDNNRAEFVIRGKKNSTALIGVVSSLIEKREITLEIEGTGPGLLVWRGYVGSAKFETFESEQVQCCLTMLLSDWFGVFPKSAIPNPIDVITRTRLYPPLLPL